MTHIHTNRSYISRQLSPVVLPAIGVRAHRVCLSHRPGLRRLTPAASETRVGPSVTPELDNPATGSWALVSFLFLVLLVGGCVAMVHR